MRDAFPSHPLPKRTRIKSKRTHNHRTPPPTELAHHSRKKKKKNRTHKHHHQPRPRLACVAAQGRGAPASSPFAHPLTMRTAAASFISYNPVPEFPKVPPPPTLKKYLKKKNMSLQTLFSFFSILFLFPALPRPALYSAHIRVFTGIANRALRDIAGRELHPDGDVIPLLRRERRLRDRGASHREQRL